MSNEAVIDPDVPVSPEPAPDPAPQEAVATPQDAAEDDIPEAVEFQPGVKYVPVGALKAVREENKALKPLAQRAAELEQQVNEFRPYVDFLRSHPTLLQPQAQQEPVKPSQADDPALVELAKTLDLYTADAKPDTARAAKIRELTRLEAQAVAQQAVAPVQEGAWEQAAAQNLQWMVSQTDAFGRPLEEAAIVASVRSIYGALPKGEALRVLSDGRVAQLIVNDAVARQSKGKPFTPAPKAPTTDPLQVEAAGGGTGPSVSEDHTRRLGVKHADYEATAKKYKPGQSNVIE